MGGGEENKQQQRPIQGSLRSAVRDDGVGGGRKKVVGGTAVPAVHCGIAGWVGTCARRECGSG